jgi:putative NIF3 family GTP cyclohydrolase 1 type 2
LPPGSRAVLASLHSSRGRGSGGIKLLSSPGIDVLIGGETREWELVEYCQDSIRAGNRKALIVVGHVLSEQGGMMLCAKWMKEFVSEVPIEFVAASEPFWNPDYPPKAWQPTVD